MPEVPAAAIPAAAWGISGHALTATEIAALDPFAGCGVRLEIPAGCQVTIGEVVMATGLEHVVLYPHCAWVRLDDLFSDPDNVRARWAAWLGPGRGDAST